MDDADLIRDWQQGGHRAFEALVRRWQEPVSRFLYHMVERKETVPDLCQEVFLRVYQARSRYRGTGKFSTWLYQIALNIARDAARRRRHQQLTLEDGDLPGEGACPVEAFAQQEIVEVVNRAIAALAEPLRSVLVLHHYEGMTFEEMAPLLDAPASTLRSRFATALGRLREQLRNWKDEETPR